MDPDIAAAFSLEGRTAVITGAARGIGRETALTYAKAGARVVLADLPTEALEEAGSLVEGGIVVPTDVTDRSAVDALAEAAVSATGRLDVWANVAGIIRNFTVVEAEEAELDAVIAVNLKGVYWGCSAAGRVMMTAGRGSIINMSSAGGEVPSPTLSAYGMTKAAVIQLTRAVAAELGPSGIRCNAVGPGFVETPMTARNWTAPDGAVDAARRAEMFDHVRSMSPLGATGEPIDIALVMLYLAADASRFVTGQVLRINGGLLMA